MLLQSLELHQDLGSPRARINLYWLTHQRDLLGDKRFHQLLGEYLDEKGREAVLAGMAQYEEARRQAGELEPAEGDDGE